MENANVASGKTGRSWAGAVASHAVLWVLASFILVPYVWMVLTAGRTPDEIFTRPFGLPALSNYISNLGAAFTIAPLGRFMFNGFAVTALILILQVVIAVPCAYALTKCRLPFSGALFGLVLAALCVPIQVPMLPLYIGLASVDALNTYVSLVVPFIASPFAIFLFRQQIQSYPSDIVRAARLDGFTEVEIITRLILPSLRPSIAAFAVFSITTHWNDLYWPMISISDVNMATPPLGLLYFRDGDVGANYGALMTAAIVTIVPMMLIYFAAQRQFARGMAVTGLR
jgi:multiple sugar transport system permease protein